MREVALPDELNTFRARFDLLKRDSCKISTPPPEDQPPSAFTADVTKFGGIVETSC